MFIETPVFTRQIRNQIFMLATYSKTTTDDLTTLQIKTLGQLVTDELKER
jgi:hypothetical protein